MGVSLGTGSREGQGKSASRLRATLWNSRLQVGDFLVISFHSLIKLEHELVTETSIAGLVKS